MNKEKIEDKLQYIKDAGFELTDYETVDMLSTLIQEERKEAVEECIKLAGIHTEHNGNYCDTGEDMDWACRSKCVEMAIKRMLEYLSQLNKEEE